MSTSVKDRVLAEYASMLDSFTNLIKAAKVAEDHADMGRAQVSRVPWLTGVAGELLFFPVPLGLTWA